MNVPLAKEVAWREGEDFIGTKLVLTIDGKMLVYLRDDFPGLAFPGHWDLPGGGREGAESAVDCALRELREEFGLGFLPSRLARRFAFSSPIDERSIAIFYTGQLDQSDIAAIRFGNEGQTWRLMAVSDYIRHAQAVPHFRARVAHCLGIVLR